MGSIASGLLSDCNNVLRFLDTPLTRTRESSTAALSISYAYNELDLHNKTSHTARNLACDLQ
jgi:hypothetical protein